MSREANAGIFGACNNPSYHGHNYELDVSVKGEIDPATGYVAAKSLNLDVPAFRDLNPTAENIVVASTG